MGGSAWNAIVFLALIGAMAMLALRMSQLQARLEALEDIDASERLEASGRAMIELMDFIDDKMEAYYERLVDLEVACRLPPGGYGATAENTGGDHADDGDRV